MKTSIALKATHLINEGAYLVSRDWLSPGHFEKAGQVLPNDRDFVVPDLDGIEWITTRRGDLVRFVDGKGGELTPEEQKARLVELRARAEECDGDWIFGDIDHEYEHKKFLAQWSPVFGPDVTVRTPVTFDITEVRTTSGDEDIQSLWNSSDTPDQCKLYQVNLDRVMIKAFREACEKAELSYDVPSHSALRFAKIEGSFAFNDAWNERKRPFIGTLKQCKAEKSQWVENVLRVVRTHAALKQQIPPKNIGQLVIEMRAIQNKLISVQAKSGSSDMLHAARKHVGELLEALEKQMEA